MLQALGNLAKGTQQQTQLAIECGLLPWLKRWIADGADSVARQASVGSHAREAAWIASNVLAGTNVQVMALIGTGVLPALRALSGAHWTTRVNWAAVALANAFVGAGGRQARTLLVVQGCDSKCT